MLPKLRTRLIAHAGLGGFGSCLTDLPGTNAFVVIQDGTAAGDVKDTEFFLMADGP